MSLENNIKNLPSDLQRLILYKFFKLEIYKILKSDKSLNLNYKPLFNLFIKYDLINKPNIINYLRESCDLFNKIYTEHYIHNNIYYINFNKLNSMCLSWIMYLYH